ncbi:hypothetical protein CcNV_039 [Crangon crangon nudivirus]|uniref:Uncharacterized protein n=1 Tax=Crangon crangon nudivirus TaxID=2880838 RepID=A0AAE8Y3C3_9VIRU|nr:hypothetical protein QKT25_gp039 [Crangon crangon nudivirus]UBZ25523.1 hypothetical protein CcNV_039 [Crangon crangon nudivirus]
MDTWQVQDILTNLDGMNDPTTNQLILRLVFASCIYANELHLVCAPLTIPLDVTLCRGKDPPDYYISLPMISYLDAIRLFESITPNLLRFMYTDFTPRQLQTFVTLTTRQTSPYMAKDVNTVLTNYSSLFAVKESSPVIAYATLIATNRAMTLFFYTSQDKVLTPLQFTKYKRKQLLPRLRQYIEYNFIVATPKHKQLYSESRLAFIARSAPERIAKLLHNNKYILDITYENSP